MTSLRFGKKERKSGVSLVEVMIAIVIVTILATVSAAIIRGHTKRAIVSEAIVAMHSLETHLKRHAETTGWLDNWYGWLYNMPEGRIPGINPSDYDGTYFSKECYFIGKITFVGGRYTYEVHMFPDPLLSQLSQAKPNNAPCSQGGKSVIDDGPRYWWEIPYLVIHYDSSTNRHDMTQSHISCSGWRSDY